MKINIKKKDTASYVHSIMMKSFLIMFFSVIMLGIVMYNSNIITNKIIIVSFGALNILLYIGTGIGIQIEKKRIDTWQKQT